MDHIHGVRNDDLPQDTAPTGPVQDHVLTMLDTSASHDLIRLKTVASPLYDHSSTGDGTTANGDIYVLSQLLEGANQRTRDTKRKIRNFFIDHQSTVFDWKRTLDISRQEYQQVCNDWTVFIGQSGVMQVEKLRDNASEFFAFFEMMGFFEHSLALKFAVQYSLWGSTLLNLGTERHHRKYLQRVNTVQLPGIFGLTELGHGSNVRETQTTATYDRRAQEFVIHTPVPSAQKYWPGHIFRYGEMGTFFARLIIDNRDYGVHAFIVPVRDHVTKKLLPGCRVRDLGPKVCMMIFSMKHWIYPPLGLTANSSKFMCSSVVQFGFNGIDNGCLSFDHVRIPRENMLDRFSEVLPDGTYVNKVGDANRHFGSIMFALCGGRIVIGTLALCAAKVAITIATRYAHHREQFGPENGPEVKIIEHVSYYCRLMPQLVRCFTADLLLKYATDVYERRDQHEPNHTHIVTSLAKIHASAFAVEACRIARESCGGQGYRHINRIPHQYESADMYTVGEGDNIALHQTVTKTLLSTYYRQRKSGKFSGLLAYLNEADLPRYKLEDNVSLRNLEYLLDAFQFRERSILLKLEHHLDATNSSTDNFERFNDNQLLVIQLSQTFMDRMIVEICLRTRDDAMIRSTQDPRQVLSNMFELDCLKRFKDGLAWFISHEYISPRLARSVDDVYQDLCRQVALVSYDLTKAFGIPDMCLPEETLVSNWFEMDLH